jgi:hypothetical protein
MTEKSERILKFIFQRKKPVTVKIVADHFAIGQSTAGTYLRRLCDEGYITRQEIDRQIFWAKKEGASLPVAVPEPITPVQPSKPAPVEREQPKVIWPTSTFQTSYPHIRGYDD